MHIDSLQGHRFGFDYFDPHQAYLLTLVFKTDQSDDQKLVSVTNQKPEFSILKNGPKLSHLTFHSFSSLETISIKNIKIMNPMKDLQIAPDWSANRRASLKIQFVNQPKAIAQSSILGGWIHNDDDRLDFLFLRLIRHPRTIRTST